MSRKSSTPVSLGAQFIRHSPRYGVGLLLLGAYQYSQYWFDTRLMEATDRAIAGEHRLAIEIGLWLIGVAAAAFVIRVFSRVAIFNGGRLAEYELRGALLARLQKLGPAFYRRMSTGEIMSRVTNDLGQVRLLLGFGVLNVINTAFGLVSALAVAISISGKLTLAALSSLPLLMIVTTRFARLIYGRMRANQDALGRMSEDVQSSIAGVRVVRSLSMEESELSRFEKSNQLYLERNLSLARLRGSMGPTMQAVIAVGMLVVFWYGGHLMLKDELSPGGFLAFYRALARLTWPLMALGFLAGLLQRGRAAYSRLAEIYEAVPEIRSGALEPPKSPSPTLRIQGLSFAYGDGREVLSEVNFELPAGTSLAIVGRTGSGKSTLATLLPRLQPLPRGRVFLDDVDICDLPLEYLRSAIGYAQQDAFLFSTTVGRNVAFALPKPDSKEALATVHQALSEASILKEVRELPDGIDTVVGERGVQLSGGQKQRVSLARAFVSEPKILVLDDPMSAVDAKTERSILEAIDRAKQGRSLILITHRVAAAARCDQVLVLEQGRIAEQGTHTELLKGGGLYAEFAEEQRIERELLRLGESESVDLTETA